MYIKKLNFFCACNKFVAIITTLTTKNLWWVEKDVDDEIEQLGFLFFQSQVFVLCSYLLIIPKILCIKLALILHLFRNLNGQFPLVKDVMMEFKGI
jgi:uncharacterized membrane protein